MRIQELINAIAKKHHANGFVLHPPARPAEIEAFEKRIGFPLPPDFKELYLICNGFECEEDIFRIIPLTEVLDRDSDYGNNWFFFAEYLIYAEVWGVRCTASEHYEIFVYDYPDKPLTFSLSVFLSKFLGGNVLEKGGLFQWQAELGIQ